MGWEREERRKSKDGVIRTFCQVMELIPRRVLLAKSHEVLMEVSLLPSVCWVVSGKLPPSLSPLTQEAGMFCRGPVVAP